MSVGSATELEGLERAGAVAARVLGLMLDAVEAGITPLELNRLGAAEMRRLGARSAPMLAVGFPSETCISVNEAVAHGVPGDRPLAPHDLVNIDVSVELGGFFADMGASRAVEPGAAGLAPLLETGRRALAAALEEVRAGAMMNRIGWGAERTARRAGYQIIRDLCGHGVGRALHEAPAEVPGFYRPGDRRRLHAGTVLAIEPFVSTGARHVRVRDDGWTLETEDGGLAVQFEHTVVVTDAGAWVVTAERPFLHPVAPGPVAHA